MRGGGIVYCGGGDTVHFTKFKTNRIQSSLRGCITAMTYELRPGLCRVRNANQIESAL